jgi:hypothetical protein
MIGLLRSLLIAIGALAPFGTSQSTFADTNLAPALLVSPIDGAELRAKNGQVDVMLAWRQPRQSGSVVFFLEVVAVDNGAVREVFAGYVDHREFTLKLYDGAADYAWRVYTVGRNAPEYAMSRWEWFSVRPAK